MTTAISLGRSETPTPGQPPTRRCRPDARRRRPRLPRPGEAAGPICNLDCQYCYFLEKEALYPGDRFRMSDLTLERYVRQVIEAQTGPEVTIAWQGGEPTLMGVDFFRRAMALVDQYRRPGQSVAHTIQTNGTLLTDEWCAFLAEHHFLVGLSIDGPRELHDAYRVDKRGRPTFARVMEGFTRLRAHGVDLNVLCTVNAANQDHPLEVYRFFRDDLDVRHIQLIPIVERVGDDQVTDRSVDPVAWGRFLSAVFDEWVVRDVGDVFVSHFDAALASWVGVRPALCIFGETCGDAVALEHNGDLYSCDHFVEPEHLLGNIAETHLVELLASKPQRAFGAAKRGHPPRLLPPVLGPVRLPRGVPEEPVRADPRRRAWSQLPLSRVPRLLHPHRRADAAHGRTGEGRPLRRRGPGHPHLGAPERPVPVRERTEGEAVPPAAGAEWPVGRGRPTVDR